MLAIRLTRKGRKNQPFFRVVVIDKRRSAKGGRAVEVLGNVDPLTKKKALKKERILHWLKCGAQPSDTVRNLLISEKIIEGKKIHVARFKAKPQDATTASAAAPIGASTSASTEATVDKTADKPATPAEAKAEEKPSAVADLPAEASAQAGVPADKAESPKEEPKKEETPKA